MTTPHTRVRHAGNWPPGTLAVAIAAIALCATIALPATVANLLGSGSGVGIADLPHVVATEFTQWQVSGKATPPALLDAAAHAWGAFHAVKACASLVLLIALGMVGRHLWRAWTRDLTPGGVAVVAAAGAWVAASAAVAGVVVVANLQGAIAPLSSLLSVAPSAAPSAAAEIASEIRAGTVGAATATLIADFRLYHAAFAGAALAALAATLAGMIRLMMLRRRMPAEPLRLRLSLTLAATAAGAAVLGIAVLIAANVATAVAPEDPLAAFLTAGG